MYEKVDAALSENGTDNDFYYVLEKWYKSENFRLS